MNVQINYNLNLREEFKRLDGESPFGEGFLDIIFRNSGSRKKSKC